MCTTCVSPTQVTTANKARCSHGYYCEFRALKTPPCPSCNPMHYSLDKRRTADALSLLALRNSRPRNDVSRFAPTATIEPGKYRCWKCRDVYDLTPENFRRAASKRTGFQGRCKHCDNVVKSERRQGKPRAGIELLLAAGVVL